MHDRTDIGTGAQTDLGAAFSKHLQAYRFNDRYTLRTIETHWLDAIRERALQPGEATLKQISDELLKLLRDPQRIEQARFKHAVEDAFQGARQHAYPICTRLLEAIHATGSVQDYTLSMIDLGQVQRMEDESRADSSMKSFMEDIGSLLDNKRKHPLTEIYRQVFDIYSEALVCRLLRLKVGPRLPVQKIRETSNAGPDFHCVLQPDSPQDTSIEFYIEVKSLDLVDAPLRTIEMLDESMNSQLEIERQLKAGAHIAMTESEIAPNRGAGDDPDYDPRSVRKNIELLCAKAANNFKSKQFKRGPTFALANLLRLAVMPQGLGRLAPFFFDGSTGGACVSGVLWNFAFGDFGDPIHRFTEFEGSYTCDGRLQRSGLLVDPASNLNAAGLIVLHEHDGFRFDGFYDSKWTSSQWGWSNLQVDEVLHALCGEWNDRKNSSAWKYSKLKRRSDES